MSDYLKVVAGILITLFVCIILAKQEKDYSILLILAVCAMVFAVSFSYLDRIVEFLSKIQSLGNLDSGMFSVLIKTLGIGILSEITSMVCVDAGNTALAKLIQFVSYAVIIWLCIPLFEKLLELIENILVAI